MKLTSSPKFKTIGRKFLLSLLAFLLLLTASPFTLCGCSKRGLPSVSEVFDSGTEKAFKTLSNYSYEDLVEAWGEAGHTFYSNESKRRQAWFLPDEPDYVAVYSDPQTNQITDAVCCHVMKARIVEVDRDAYQVIVRPLDGEPELALCELIRSDIFSYQIIITQYLVPGQLVHITYTEDIRLQEGKLPLIDSVHDMEFFDQ